MKTHSRRRRLIIALIIIILLAGLITAGLLTSKYSLTTVNYAIERKELTESIRIVQLADLHNSQFGENNSRLVELVAEQNPDLILIVGDLLNQDDENSDIAVGLIKELAKIAPLYVSYGNHEAGYERRYNADLRSLYTEAGATVLEYDWMDIEVKGQDIRLGGLYGYCLPAYLLKTGEARVNETEFLFDFLETDNMTVLMCHMPVCWIRNESLDEWDVDIVLSGHAHGGQIRIPFVGGLWAPDQGWWPGEDAGLYWSKDGEKVMVLTRGLGSNEKIPRFNNIPEVTVVDLVPVN